MNFKSSVIAAGLLFSSAMAFAATPVTLTVLNPAAPNVLNASFSALASGMEFSFFLNAGDVLDKLTVTSTHYAKSTTQTGPYQQTSGFDISAVYLDGAEVGSDTAALPTSVKVGKTWTMTDHDNWIFVPSQPLAAGSHIIKVQGNSVFGGGFSGNVQITQGLTPAVPEPQTYAMLLAGLGAIGFLIRRRAAV